MPIRRTAVSALIAAVITVLLFICMTLLIRVEFHEPDIRQIPLVKVELIKEQVSVRTPKPIRKLELEDVEQQPQPASLHSKPVKSTSPTIRKVSYNSKISQTYSSPNLAYFRTLKSNLTGRGVSTVTSGNGIGMQGSGRGKGIGLVDGPDGIACTIGIILSDIQTIEELQWYNCRDRQISDNSEIKLYQWIKNHPLEMGDYAKSIGQEIFFTFDSST